jgi:hypothetical protein
VKEEILANEKGDKFYYLISNYDLSMIGCRMEGILLKYRQETISPYDSWEQMAGATIDVGVSEDIGERTG